ncbi:uncharacterized protein VK521_002972 [Ammospiza maritima maritima]
MAPGAPRRTPGPPGAPRAPPVPPPRPGRKNRRSSEWPVQQKLRELFAVPRCVVSVFSLFLVELIRFLGEAVVQALVVGVLTAVGEHVLKPLLAALLHSLLQPLLLFVQKVLGGVRDLAEPLLDVLARLCSQLAVLLRAVRLVEIRLRPDLRAGPAD